MTPKTPINNNVDTKSEGFCFFFIIIGVPFLVISGSIFVLSLFPALQDLKRMQSWESTEGIVVFEEKRKFYIYEVDNKQYKSSRATIFREEIEDAFWQDINIESGDQLNLWYNIKKPSESTLDKNMPWEKFFIKLLIMLVLGFLGYWLVKLRISIDYKKAPPDYDERPWVYDFSENLDGVFKSDGKSRIKEAWIAAIGLNLITLPMAVFMLMNIELAWGFSKLLFLFALVLIFIGLVLIPNIYYSKKGWEYYGKTLLKIESFPGVIGGSLNGDISVLKDYEDKDFKVSLHCNQYYETTSGSDGRNSTKSIHSHRKELWCDDMYATKKVAPEGVYLSFSFDIPKGLPESSPASTSYHYWELNIESEGGKSIMLFRSFVVPVYDLNRTDDDDYYNEDDKDFV